MIHRKLTAWLTDGANSQSLGSKLRRKRARLLVAVIDQVLADHNCCNIIDIGGTAEYWSLLPVQYIQNKKVAITIVNAPGVPLPDSYGCFRFVNADGCDMRGFSDRSFHIAHSNSVIEHVGDWCRMKLFANEVARLGERYFVQTPNFWFPIEPHCMTPFFHWLPKPTRVWLVTRFSLGHYPRANSVSQAVQIVDGSRLLSRKMMRELFADASILTERFILLPKSLVAVR